MSRQATSIFLFAGVLLLVGCPAGSPEDNGEPDDQRPPTSAPWKGDFQTVQGDWADLDRTIQQYKGKKVVIVDLWTTWGKASIRELTYLAELQKQNPDKVVCIAVNLDHALGKPKPDQAAIQKIQRVLRERFGKALDEKSALPDDFRLFVSLQPDESFVADGGFDFVRSVLIYDQSGQRTVIDEGVARMNRGLPEESEEDVEIQYARDVTPVLKKLLQSSK